MSTPRSKRSRVLGEYLVFWEYKAWVLVRTCVKQAFTDIEYTHRIPKLYPGKYNYAYISEVLVSILCTVPVPILDLIKWEVLLCTQEHLSGLKCTQRVRE